MARSRRPSFKGCCVMCAWSKGKVRGLGQAQRNPVRDLRRLGKRRRLSRRDIPRDQLV
jgi:hypothetical protein